MVNPDHIGKLKQGIETWNEWKSSKSIEFIAGLSGADLSGVDLRGINLFRADLSRANLSGANLS